MTIKDGQWELFDWDRHTGRTVWRYFDGQATHFRTDTPVDAVLKANAEAQADHQGARWGDGRRVASIPSNLFHTHLAEAHAQGDRAYVRRWLNDSDNAGFRTFGGRV